MVVRFTQLKFPAEQVDKARTIYYDVIAPAIRSSEGNKQAILLEPEENTEDFISFSLWESPQALTAFESSENYKSVIGKIKEVALSAVPKYYHVKE